MCPHVTLLTLTLSERLAANAAAEWLFVRVDAEMRLQVALGRERLPARCASEVFPRDALQDEAWCVALTLQIRGHSLSPFCLHSCRNITPEKLEVTIITFIILSFFSQLPSTNKQINNDKYVEVNQRLLV